MSTYPAGEIASSDKHGSGSGEKSVFKVEVRTSYHSPTVLGDFVIDHCWREVPIYEGRSPWSTNVPVKSWDRDTLAHGLVPYVVAETHRWAFLAHLEAANISGALCIETRLVEVRFSYSWSTNEVGVSEPEGWERRSRATFSPRVRAQAKEPRDGG